MANNLIRNETKVFYTVQVSDNVVVSGSDFYRGEVENVRVYRKRNVATKYDRKSTASKVAAFVDGKLIKHTRTEVVTEITEEIDLEVVSNE